ncbi:RodZ domain-containing protein [Streptomyces sp. NPDC046887]|uniref:helix-turn-helix domain-containing protein n=1 Tax=Streptomyces sp. NPDC046887 TaxID=3155472 RepID=UPI0033F9C4A1
MGNSPEEEQPSTTPDPEPAEDRPSIGSVLRHARTASGLTVEEVSASTRVRVPIVHAIEEDDFSRCGGDVYARGHIRTLARAAGLDADALVERYDAEHGGRPAPTPAAPMFEAERIRPERRRPNWTAAMVAAIVAVIGFVGFTLFSGGEPDARGSNVAGDPASPAQESVSPPKPSKAAPRPAPAESAIAAVPKDRVTVKLTAVQGKSWVTATGTNGKRLFDGLLDQKGPEKSARTVDVEDPEQVDLVLGNAGAIELFVNGKKVEDRYALGEVKRISYQKGDDPQDG